MAASATYSQNYTRFRDESDGESPKCSPSSSRRGWPFLRPWNEILSSVTRIGRPATPAHILLVSDEYAEDERLDKRPVTPRFVLFFFFVSF